MKINQQLSILVGIFFFISNILVLAFVLYNFTFVTHNSVNQKKHRLILIVLDAFRHDYFEIAKLRKVDLPNLNRMAEKGARSMKVIPVYPSVTMPNHQTLVTGLYTPYHGITYNDFNDSSMGYDQFSMDNQTSLNEARWYTGYPDPIWVSCEKSLYCKSGSMLWPNTDAVFNGYRPFRYIGQYTPLNQKPNIIYPYDRRVDELISWMKNDLIDFGLLYFDEPDATSHENGPFHDKTLLKIQEMDGYLGRLIQGLEKYDLLKETDILLTGDHGMTEMSLDRVINIDQFVPPDLYKSTYSYPVGIIYPNEGKFNEVFQLYSAASEHIRVYKRENIPKDLYYTDNTRRISPIVTVVDQGWFVNCSHYKKRFYKGYHGYSPYEEDMKTTLLAMGPSFKNIIMNTTSHVDLYSLMMHLLGLKVNPNNGSFERISVSLTQEALKWKDIENKWNYNRVVILVFVMILFETVLSILFLILLLHKRFILKSTGVILMKDKTENV